MEWIEELGDVLFHVVFHASIGNEEGHFNITDVVNGIIAKMVYRHPHVFGEKEINNTKWSSKELGWVKRRKEIRYPYRRNEGYCQKHYLL